MPIFLTGRSNVSYCGKAKALTESIKYPVLLKPLDLNHGKGATINVDSWEEDLKHLKLHNVFR